jgi:hypothetical protein
MPSASLCKPYVPRRDSGRSDGLDELARALMQRSVSPDDNSPSATASCPTAAAPRPI